MSSDVQELAVKASSEAAATMVAASAFAKVLSVPGADGLPFVIVPEGFGVVHAPSRDLPAAPKGLVKLRDVHSFMAYFNDHAVPRSRVYALLDPARFLAVFDDFGVSVPGESDLTVQADWRGFRAAFDVPASREWITWNKANRQHMTQVGFAEFLLDNLPDVKTPDGSALYDMALRFEASQGGSFKSAVRLQDGSHQLQWVAETTQSAPGELKLPEFFVLAIPVFENQEPVELQARLRYRVKDGALSIWFELVRPHKVLEAQFRSIWQMITAGCKTTILLGTPE